MDLEKIGEGRLAEIFSWGDGQALKLYRSPDHDWAAAEAEATEAVHRAGVPAPRCYGTIEIDGRTGLILDRLSGPVLGDVMFGTDGEAALRGLGRLHAEIHACRGDGFTSLRSRLEHRIAGTLPGGMASRVLERMADLPDGDAVLHSDLHPYNVMQHHGRWLAIDWNAALQGPPGYDVARTLFLLTEATYVEVTFADDMAERRQEAADRYLAAYIGQRSLDLGELAAWRLPVVAARLAEPIDAERDHLLAEVERLLGS